MRTYRDAPSRRNFRRNRRGGLGVKRRSASAFAPARSCSRAICDRGRLDLDLGGRLEQARHHDHRHRGVVAPHDGAVGLAQVLGLGEVLLAVGDVPGQPYDVLWPRARPGVLGGGGVPPGWGVSPGPLSAASGPRPRLGEQGGDVAQRLARLAGEVGMREGAGLVPADHPAGEDEAVRLDPVRVALRRRPARRLQGPHERSRSTVRWTLPVGVRGSASRNSTRRGYLYGAILAFTWSWSSFAVTGPLLTMNALTTWPRSASGAATTAHSATAGCSSSAASTSKPEML